ncbi:MAG TPA: ABC-F family ATP-binding cassette domain-containing protein [Perlabentimonas sp.]|nr:ABC-F family ATP-binding cassette domain-containing protein [Bacteroidales bacterium]MDD4673553.1 ABC-F family ATP-binding cassette domain-containing protein [Bacteroidales bacterium]MDY0349110.1 ABC-F family ATP-binding cassette domain-containing protein [Tenuifilaceae bacterium]HZJ73733.1 ABC-F family ATP-binding cassette domain-containing protein [Perlabentimonas sp.]
MIPYLQVEDISKSFGDLVLFTDIKFTIGKDQRVGLIARNGAGKTTLLRIIAGLESKDSGSIVWQNDLRLGYLEQNPVLDPQKSIVENVFLSSEHKGEAILTYQKAMISHQKHEMQVALDLMEKHNAWDIEVKARQILTQLKITDLEQPVDTLSGGQQKRVALAAALINEPDFLILDEPTNHLDLDMVEWLEEFLKTSRITLLMVTHDRFFLDRICTDIIEFDHKELYWYKGNYAYYIEKRQERIEARSAQVDKASNLLKKELDWMRRSPPARTTKAKYRIDAFYELREKASQRFDSSNVRIKVGAARLGKKILEAKGLHKSFGDITILKDFSYTFNRYERLGIVGDNGTGKSTFINVITQSIPADKGVIDVGETVVFGYYRQEGMAIREDMRVIDVAREIAEVITLGDGKTLSVSQFLNMFLFAPDVQNSYVHKLSGGEKRRLYLLTILMRSPNFLILDEPTNDLDIETLNVLESYLENFPGVVLVVSHDRHFLEKVVDGLLIFEGNGEISGFPGSYTDYYEWKKEQQRIQQQDAKPEVPKSKPKTSKSKPRKLTFAERKEMDALSEEIERLENEKAEAEQKIGSNTLSHEELTTLAERIAELISLLDTKGERWLELMEIDENAG